MKQYLELCEKILNEGTFKEDRTGTGTVSIFGHQMRFNLQDGFPLITTKEISMMLIATELAFFLRGDTNIYSLVVRKNHIWDDWPYKRYKLSDEYAGETMREFARRVVNEEDFAYKWGDLGPVYGKQWVSWEHTSYAEPIVLAYTKPDINQGIKLCSGDGSYDPDVFGVACLGDAVSVEDKDLLYNIWAGMISRCYNNLDEDYKTHGANGVFVHNEWLVFSNFVRDAKKLDNWLLKKEYPKEYLLDISYHSSNCYSAKSCLWLSKLDIESNFKKTQPLKVISEDGKEYTRIGADSVYKEFNIDYKHISSMLMGDSSGYNGWRVEKHPDITGAKIQTYNQIKNIIATLKNVPYDRGIILNAWNVGELSGMALRPCHTMAQFYVLDGKLSCQLYQRSGDVFLGVPFNIASYALLTHLLARAAGLEVGELVHTLGDAHIYSNHIEQVKTQLTREPRPLPRLEISPDLKSIFDFQYEHIKVVGYNPHPTIKGDISV